MVKARENLVGLAIFSSKTRMIALLNRDEILISAERDPCTLPKRAKAVSRRN